MDAFLNKLRSKPRKYRIRIVFLVAGVVTGVIAVAWLSVLGVNVNDSLTRQADDISPLSQLRSNVAEFMEGIRGSK